MVTVIYIAGYGRSGSTLLELALSAHPQVAGLGELAYFGHEHRAARSCACGVSLTSCTFWNEALARAGVQADGIGVTGPAARSLVQAAAAVSGCDTVVDSSKSTRRTLFRSRDLARDHDVLVVHLVRAPGAVAAAVEAGTNKQREVGQVTGSRRARRFRALAGWTAANRAARWASRRQRSMLVTFDGFLADPSRTVGEILSVAGLDPEPAVRHLQAGRPLAGGHGVGGNRLRRTGKPVTIDPSAAAPASDAHCRGLERLAGVQRTGDR